MVARLGLSSHTVSIERSRNGDWSLLASGGSVKPEESLRFSAHFGLSFASREAEFRVLDASGAVVWGPEKFSANWAGNAFVDASAPILPGVYTLVGTGRQPRFGALDPGLPSLWTAHDITRTFVVSRSAPPAPGGGFGWPDFNIGDIFGQPWAWVFVLGAIIALGILI